jgi:hypothetical protein
MPVYRLPYYIDRACPGEVGTGSPKDIRKCVILEHIPFPEERDVL